jgi:hypothetical protein
LIALVSFSLGIFFFQEPIHSQMMACVAVGMMVLGFSGMSYFSTRNPAEESTKTTSMTSDVDEGILLHPGRHQLLDACSMGPFSTRPSSSGSSLPQSCPCSEDSIGDSIELVEEASLMQSVSKEVHDFESKTQNGKQPNDGEQEGGGLRHRHIQHLVHHHTNETVHFPKHVIVSQFNATPPIVTKSFLELLLQSSNHRITLNLVTLC